MADFSTYFRITAFILDLTFLSAFRDEHLSPSPWCFWIFKRRYLTTKQPFTTTTVLPTPQFIATNTPFVTTNKVTESTLITEGTLMVNPGSVEPTGGTELPLTDATTSVLTSEATTTSSITLIITSTSSTEGTDEGKTVEPSTDLPEYSTGVTVEDGGSTGITEAVDDGNTNDDTDTDDTER